MREMVAGFLFDANKQNVALVRKNKPTWMEGLLNGIGGKVEADESPADAMTREFKEEAGIGCLEWQQFCLLTDGETWRVHFYRAFSNLIDRVKTMEAEPIEIHGVDELDNTECVPNLAWLIPMALSFDADSWVFEIRERHR